MNKPAPLTKKRRAALARFLDRPDNPEGTLPFHSVQGFFFALAWAPDIVPMHEWLPLLFGEADPPFADLDEANHVMALLMDLYNESMPGTRVRRVRLPVDCVFRDDVLSNLEPEAPMSQWCRGFTLGHSWLLDSWEEALDEELANEMAVLLMTLSYFSSRELAEAFLAEVHETRPAAGGEGSRDDAPAEPVTLEHFATAMRESFDFAVSDYAAIGNEVALERMAEHTPSAPPDTPGRNAPCPCGSGNKYKKCCGAPMN